MDVKSASPGSSSTVMILLPLVNLDIGNLDVADGMIQVPMNKRIIPTAKYFLFKDIHPI